MRLDEKDMQPKSLKGKTFGKTIQEYRLRNGWTQDELSWRTGINRTHIGRIERDECVPASIYSQDRVIVCNAFGRRDFDKPCRGRANR